VHLSSPPGAHPLPPPVRGPPARRRAVLVSPSVTLAAGTDREVRS
jgi:hypothetical protein